MPTSRCRILTIQRHLSLYGECLHRALFRGESCRIFHHGALLTTCPVREALVNSAMPVRQIILQLPPQQWDLRQALMDLGRAHAPLILKLQKESSPEPIVFAVRSRGNVPDICLPSHNLTLDAPLATWAHTRQAKLGIGGVEMGSFPLYRALFNPDTAIGIDLDDEIATSVMVALEDGQEVGLTMNEPQINTDAHR